MKTFTLTPENDPRELAFYKKAFPGIDKKKQAELRKTWIKNNVKKNIQIKYHNR